MALAGAGDASGHGAATAPVVRHLDGRFGLSAEQARGLGTPSGPSARRAGRAAEPFLPAQTWCGTPQKVDDTEHALTTLPRFKVVYAHPIDVAPRFATYQDLMQRSAGWVADKIATGAGAERSLRFDYGTSCGPQYLDITTVTLPRTAAEYLETDELRSDRFFADFRSVIAGMRLDRGVWNFLVFADHIGSPTFSAGQGDIREDDTPGPGNAHNRGGLVSVLYGSGSPDFMGGYGTGFTAHAATHEVGHNLGAVQQSAPNSTGAYHCRDGFAIMCYDDGGPTATQIDPRPCTSGALFTYDNTAFDCGENDYLAAHPDAASYLFGRWNIFTSAFTCAVGTCLASTVEPEARVTAALAEASAGTSLVLDAGTSTDRDGTIAAYQWDLDGDGTYERDTGTVARTEVRRDRAAAVRVGLRVVDDDGLSDEVAAPELTFYNRRPRAEIGADRLSAPLGTPIVFDALRSDDPDEQDALKAAYWYFEDGTWRGPVDPRAPMPWTFPAVGRHVARLVVHDSSGGDSEIAQLAVDVTAPPAPTPTPRPVTPAARRLTISSLRKRGRRITVVLRCAPGAGACVSEVRLAARGRTLRRQTVTVPPATLRTVRLTGPRRVAPRTVVELRIPGQTRPYANRRIPRG